MRVLVTGKDGQLGRALEERVEREADGKLQFQFVDRAQLDLGQPDRFAGIVDELAPDVLINCAAYTNVDQAEDEPEAAMAINAAAPGRLAEIVNRRGGRFVQISTDYVFDGSKPTPYVELDQTNPQSVYGQSKVAGELRVREACARHVIVRTAWVYSPFGRNFPKTMLRLARERAELNIVADQFGTPTSAHDLAAGLLVMCRYWLTEPDMGVGRTLHLAGRGKANWAEVAKLVFAASERHGGPQALVREIPTEAYPTKARRPANSQLDSGLFRETFGYHAPNWQQSLEEVVRWLVAEDEF